MADPSFPLIPVLAFLSLLLTVAPFGYISSSDHTGIIVFMIWQSTNCIQILVNRILWHGTTEDIAPLWCDISSNIDVGRIIGIPASVLCMMRGIHRVVRMDNHFDNNLKKRRTILQCLAIAMLFPIVVISLQPLIAVRRYVIVEDSGCTGWIASNWVTLAVLAVWPLVLSIITLIYCVLTFRACWTMSRERMFTGQSELNRFLFSRTFVCAGVITFTLFPVCAYNLIYLLRSGVGPYPGIEKIMKYRQDVSIISDPSKWDSIQNTYIAVVERLLPSFCFFLVFGTGNVAVSYYSRVFSRISTRLGLSWIASQSSMEIEIEFATPSDVEKTGTTQRNLVSDW